MPRLNPFKKESLVSEYLKNSRSTLRGSSTSSRVVSDTAAVDVVAAAGDDIVVGTAVGIVVAVRAPRPNTYAA